MALPPSKKFKLDGAGGNPIWRATLHDERWGIQSFGYDHLHDHVFFAEHDPDSTGSHQGDLRLTKTDYSGNVLGSMKLLKFGHASSIGVQAHDDGPPHIWIEGDGADGAGNRLAVFTYGDGETVDYDGTSYPIHDRTPRISSYDTLPRPAIDPLTNRLLVRYRTKDDDVHPWRIVVFAMEDANDDKLGDDYRMAERAIPTNGELGLTDDDLFQGITACGQYAYLLYGGNDSASWLVTLDMNDVGGSYVEKFMTSAGESLPNREAQGIAIWMHEGDPRLAYGYSSKVPGTLHREANVFYKSEFV